MAQLQEENQRLKRLVADLTLDKTMLQEISFIFARRLVVEKVVAQDNVTGRTNIKNFLTWYAARLLKGGFNLYRDDHNIFGRVAVDARGDMLTIR